MEIPELVKICLEHFGGYLVGSAAERLYKEQEGEVFNRSVTIKDYDIIIPPIWFNKFLVIANNYKFHKLKRLGGIKLEDNKGNIYDIWSMDLGQFYNTLPERYSGYAMNLNREFIKRL